MQMLLQPMREALQPDTGYARERAAALAKVARLRRAKRRAILAMPLRAVRKLPKLLRRIPPRRARFSR